jgi:hypothetical protein
MQQGKPRTINTPTGNYWKTEPVSFNEYLLNLMVITYVYHLDILGSDGLCGLRPVLAIKNCPTIEKSLIRTINIDKTWIAHRSLSSLMVVITTLLGWIPMGEVAPLDLSRCTRST